MPKLTIVFGVLLILIGVLGYVLADEDSKSPTAFIPAFFGLPLAVVGGVALNERFFKHAMHGAAAIGLLGFLGAGVMGLKGLPGLIDGTAERPLAIQMQLLMAAVCLIFVGLCVKSFIDARKRKNAESA